MISLRLLCFLLMGIFCVSIHILSPPSLKKYVNSPTMSSFFGPQVFGPMNGTAIYVDGNYCNPILQKGKTGGIEIGNYTGYIIVTEPTYGCMFRTPYLNLDETGAIAILDISEFPIPGSVHFANDGIGTDVTHGKAPWMEIPREEIRDLINYLKNPEYKFDVVIEVNLPEQNYWVEMYSSALFIAIVRVFIPLLLFPTSIYAFHGIWLVYSAPQSSMSTTKIVVFVIEGVAMFLNGFYYSVNGILASAVVPYQAFWFFFPGFQGIGLFSTVIVALFYYNINKSNKKLADVGDIFRNYPIFLSFIGIVFIGMEITGGLMHIFGVNVVMVITIQIILIDIANIIVAIFLVREKIMFVAHINKRAKSWNATAAAQSVQLMCQYTGKWLLISAGFMMLAVIATGFQALVIIRYPQPFMWIMAIVMFARWGTGFSQIKALRYRDKKKKTTNSTPIPPQKIQDKSLFTNTSQNEQILGNETPAINDGKKSEKIVIISL
eukprot:c21851_g1_i4.p1 GENE.c21851_g1_i4~~c21851_g1_i4.p1  ORF type:complete len:506 (+),score=156.17 c21851_g1_i4:44-1519(+)